MRILVLGGTSFVGRAIVADALAHGDEVTLFSRGRTGADLFPEARRLTGDRESGDYAALGEGAWDATVDVSGYVPRHVAQATGALGERAGRYLFISTGSVYDLARATDDLTEDAARLEPIRDTETITGDTYGRLKVACEDDVLATFGDRATIVRPGIVGGPHDPTDRLTYWVRRAARGGQVALPGDPDQPVQVVDAGDLARLVMTLLAADQSGTYNAVGPADPVTLRELVETCAHAAGTSVDVIPVPADSVAPGFPLVLRDRAAYPLFRRNAAKARAAGMPATPLAATATDVLAWDHARGLPALAVDLPPAREAELVAAAAL
ncbi:MAG: NAD-dependent epimerase/dehydratase family protein [Actinomycetota bacterium]|nr:NAD-dependent epimerase/dehydratase family protein [Actinomycetota bacterium]